MNALIRRKKSLEKFYGKRWVQPNDNKSRRKKEKSKAIQSQAATISDAKVLNKIYDARLKKL